MANLGKVVQVIGSTLDAEFMPEHLPGIYNALEVKNPATGKKQPVPLDPVGRIYDNFNGDRYHVAGQADEELDGGDGYIVASEGQLGWVGKDGRGTRHSPGAQMDLRLIDFPGFEP